MNDDPEVVPPPDDGGRRFPTAVVYAAFGASGAAALAYEVAWTRSLSLVLGSTTYAVSTMLATFMAGLALGSSLGGRWADRSRRPLALFGLCEIGIGLAGLASVPLIAAMPPVYLGIYRALHLRPAAFLVGQALLCAAVMIVPTVLMGATFPLVSRAATSHLGEMGRRVGQAYTANTLGAVAGSLAAGFLLVPFLGLRGAVVTAGAVNLAAGVAMLLVAGRGAHRAALAAPILFAALAATLGGGEDGTGFLGFYNAHRLLGAEPAGEISRRIESEYRPLLSRTTAEGTVRAFRDPGGHLLLLVGGKPEGTGPRDVANTLLLGWLPAAAHGAPRRALVVGLGAGVTLAATREQVPEVDVAEIHPAVIEAVERHGPAGCLDGAGILRGDARNVLLRSDATYDVITSEPSYPSEPMVGNLFTREFFELAASRLSDGGVLAQWLPYYLLDDDDVTLALRTFASVFPETLVFRVNDGLDLILLGSRRPFRTSPDEIRRRVAAMNRRGVRLDYSLSRDEAGVRADLAREPGPLNTDDRPILEYRVVRNLLAGGPRPDDDDGRTP